ncbi:MAG: hypothetical protein ABI156_15305 [Caldimonas sp.]
MMMLDTCAIRLHRQRGTTLIEALIAFLVLALGILAIGRVQTYLRLGSDVARQRSEAVRLGQEDLETLRAYSVIAAASGARSFAEIASAAATIDAGSGYATNTQYRLTREIQPGASDATKSARVTVAWADRTGDAQYVVLNSIIAGNDPAYSAALTLAPNGNPIKGAFGRSAFIPLQSKNLGDGRSAYKPVGASGIVYVFDNATGLVSERCTGVDLALATRDLTAADLAGCDTAGGYLLSGTIRFSRNATPDAAQARDSPLDLAVTLATSGGTYPASPSCSSAALKTVSYANAGSTRTEAVPIAATPASLGLAAWTDSGDRYVAYHCVVYPRADGRWSGRSTLVPTGWTIGTSAADLRVCRYAADTDGSGTVDANIEHPASYAAVAMPLANQNFLVIAGTQTCPTGNAVSVRGAAGDVVLNVATEPHQP